MNSLAGKTIRWRFGRLLRHAALSEQGENAIVADAGRNLATRTPDRFWSGRAKPGCRRKLKWIELVR